MQPYHNREEKYFWSPAVAQKNMFDIGDLWEPKFQLQKNQKVATFGSCFAQHFGRALQQSGYRWLMTELPPVGLSPENTKKFNFNVFTARTGNIYTVSLLKQWLEWSLEGKQVPEEVWEKGGRFYDPFRPNIEPNGFASASEMVASREVTIRSFAQSVKDASLFVFTLGLTESWFHKKLGYEYPMCPGTIAGDFDPGVHGFVNQDYQYIRECLISCINLMRKHNPALRILLTVSPVPLTATMTQNHVLVATMESKSILRAVAGKVSGQLRFVDYFPSYEIINATPYKGVFFEPNLRGVNPAGVNHVMKNFFSCMEKKFPPKIQQNKKNPPEKNVASVARSIPKNPRNEDVICEEALLDAFSTKNKV